MIYSFTQKQLHEFYDWEKQYRGWQLTHDVSSIEPEFKYYRRIKNESANLLNDGRVPSVLSQLTKSVQSLFAKYRKDEETAAEALSTSNAKILVELSSLKLILPREQTTRLLEIEQLLVTIARGQHQVSFEIIASHNLIYLQLTCIRNSTNFIVSQIKAYFPQLTVQEINDVLCTTLNNSCVSITDLGLQNEFFLPLQTTNNVDSFVTLFATFEELQLYELGIIQVIFKYSKAPWRKIINSAITNELGEPYFHNSPELLLGSKLKTDSPLFGCVLRVITKASTQERRTKLLNVISGTLIQCSSSSENSLIRLSNDNYELNEHLNDVIRRESHRIPMVVNLRELVTFVHFPTTSVKNDKYQLSFKKQKQVPNNCINNDFTIGDNEWNNTIKQVSLNSIQRARHTAITGGSGVGKSTLLLHMIIEDMIANRGVAVMDSHGLNDQVLKYIPKHRRKDVIIIDRSDDQYCVSLNILKTFSSIEREVLSSDLVAAFKRNSYSWGDGLNTIFSQAIQTITYSSYGGNLLDVKRFLLEKDFREEYLKTVDDATSQYFWKHEYPLLRATSTASILTRLDNFLRPRAIRNMILQDGSLNFQEIFNDKKILLIKLPHGLIGAENSYLLGTLIASKIYQAAIARPTINIEDNFYFYIDEFHNFLSPTISEILSGARQYKLSLILANQTLAQITDVNILESIAANANIRICFRLSSSDAKKMSEQFSSFDEFDFQRLNVGEAIMKVDGSQFDFNLTTRTVVGTQNTDIEIQNLINDSRMKFAHPVKTIEQNLASQLNKIAAKDHQKPVASKGPDTGNNVIESASKVKTPVEVNQYIKKETERTSEHRYLQNLIKQTAEQFGFIAKIEQQLPDGNGQVDVLLCKNEETIAVEISVRTGKKWEVHNIKKCIAANYDVIVSLAQSERQARQIKNEFEQIKLQTTIPVYFFTVETFFAFMEKEKITMARNQMLGYQVNVSYGKST